MKHKFLSLTLLGVMASTLFLSCQNVDEPNANFQEEPENKLVEYSISVNIPDGLRTRSSSEAVVGENGLYYFPPRKIDKLWYCAYYNGQKYPGEITRNDDKDFKATVSLKGNIDPSQLYFFFWAGNSDDKVVTNGTHSEAEDVFLNYNAKCVIIEPNKLNFSNFEVLDSFAGYFQYSESNDNSVKSKSLTLKRPFAEFHVLTDDFTEGKLERDYTSGFTAYVGFGQNSSNSTQIFRTNANMPNTWHYDTNTLSFCSIDTSFTVSSNNSKYNFGFYNDLKQTTVSRVSFKGRQMDYLHLFYILAPIEKSPLVKDGNVLDKLNFSIHPQEDETNYWMFSISNEFFSIPLPEGGLKANNKYIIYNKSIDDGGSGFLDRYWDFEVLVNNDETWDEPVSETEVD